MHLFLSRSQCGVYVFFFFFSSRRRHTRCSRDWSSDVCSSDLAQKDGYEAVQLGLVEFIKPQRITKPMAGHFKKANAAPMRLLGEVRLEDSAEETKVGDRVLVDRFQPGEYVDITGVSKGKGFQGGVKRWHYRGGDSTHGSMV